MLHEQGNRQLAKTAPPVRHLGLGFQDGWWHSFGQPALELSAGPRILKTWRWVTSAVLSAQVPVTQRLLRHRHRRLLSTGRRAVEQHSSGSAPGAAGGFLDQLSSPMSPSPLGTLCLTSSEPVCPVQIPRFPSVQAQYLTWSQPRCKLARWG
jgi:hypothetical protein